MNLLSIQIAQIGWIVYLTGNNMDKQETIASIKNALLQLQNVKRFREVKPRNVSLPKTKANSALYDILISKGIDTEALLKAIQ